MERGRHNESIRPTPWGYTTPNARVLYGMPTLMAYARIWRECVSLHVENMLWHGVPVQCMVVYGGIAMRHMDSSE